MPKIGRIWNRDLGLACLFLLAITQVLFTLLQAQIGDRTKAAVSEVISGTNANINPLFLSQAVAGLEAVGLIECVQVNKVGIAQPFYRSFRGNCDFGTSEFWLQGARRRATVRSPNGDIWEIRLVSLNGPVFYLSLWLTRIFFILCGLGGYSWYEMRLRARRRLEALQLESALKMSRLAAQVSHDIRSPLAVLDTLVKTSEFEIQQKGLIIASVNRIREIANDLLHQQRVASAGDQESKLVICNVASLAEAIVEEKRVQFAGQKNVSIEFACGNKAQVVAFAVPSELLRVLSNILNNAVEATASGTIKVSIERLEDEVSLNIRDPGCGVPSHVLERLGRDRVSSGKVGGESGSGLGVLYARECIEQWGGRLEIESEVGKGTTVRMILSAKGIRGFGENNTVVLLDNDETIQKLWTVCAARSARKIICFSTSSELLASLERIPISSEFYIDLDLGSEQRTGLEVAHDLFARGYTNLFFETGRPTGDLISPEWIKGVIGKAPPWV